MITKNIRTHKIILSDWRALSITKAQYEFYQEEMKMKWYNDFIEINDIDTNKLFYNWKKSWIKEFIEINNIKYNFWDRIVCDFWMRHPLSQIWDCNCKKEFWCYSFQFHDWLNKKGYNFFYSSDIKQSWIDEYKQNKLKSI